MNGCLAAFLLVSTLFQSTDEPKVRHLSVVSNYSTEIVFKFAYPIFIENEPVKEGAIDCFISRLKSTGLLSDVQVTLKPTEDGKWVDIDIAPTWNKQRKNFVISEINFEGFDGFNLAKLREALKRRDFQPGISLWKFALWEIGNMVDEAASKIYASDDLMMKRIADVDMPHPRFYLQVIDSVNVQLTISLHRQYPCRTPEGWTHFIKPPPS